MASRAVEPIEVFADLLCPFAHVVLRWLIEERTARRAAGPCLFVRAWPLELVNGEPTSTALVSEEIDALQSTVAPELFRGFTAARFPTSSLAPLAIVAAAYRHSIETGEAVSLALRDAVFEHGKDITDAALLASLARDHGIGGATEADTQRVVDDWHEGRRRGVAGSPHFFVGGEGYFAPGLKVDNAEGIRIEFDEAVRDAFISRALG